VTEHLVLNAKRSDRMTASNDQNLWMSLGEAA